MYLTKSPLSRLSSLSLIAFLAIGTSLAIASETQGNSHNKKHGEMHADEHGNKSKMGIGEPGDASQVTRTITVTMTDNAFDPEEISIKEGETIRFVVKNDGEFVHEFNIGTAVMHAGHQKEMMMMVEHGALEADKINHSMMKMDMGDGKTMMHDDPNSVLLEPSKSAEIIWKFSKKAELEFACNVPGHYDSGMMGEIEIH